MNGSLDGGLGGRQAAGVTIEPGGRTGGGGTRGPGAWEQQPHTAGGGSGGGTDSGT